jgi:polyisoprenoid-binding protein YceI
MRILRIITAALLITLPAALAQAADFVVKPGKPNEVVFTSKAATESFQGRTDQITGTISVDPAQLTDTVTVNLEVDLTTLKTGIGKRDSHMRENHLETKKYPKATFKGATLRGTSAKMLSGSPEKFEVEGDFTLHGVTRRLRANVEVSLKDPTTLEFKAAFMVPLADYKIDRPKFLFLKLGEVQELAVTGTAKLTS